jgi:hypothetical protein
LVILYRLDFFSIGLGFHGGANTVGASFFAISEHGPELWTGGAYGPIAGLLGMAAFILGFLVIVAWVRLRRGRAGLDLSIAQPPARRAIGAARRAAAPAR